jgi:sugar/nucleoside kinase (ribokinase family)
LLVCVGSIAFDSVETPDGRADEVLGGSGTFFGLSAALFGPVGLVGIVGEDMPESTLELLRSRGVDTAGVERAPGRTFRWAGRYVDDMNVRETTNLELNVLAEFDPKLPPAYRASEYCFLANTSPVIQQSVMDQLEEPRLVLSDTMNHYILEEHDELLRLLKRVDGVIINDEEAMMLAGRKNLVAAARAVSALGPRIVVLKKGAHGSLISVDDTISPLPAFPLEEVADPTGAGDCFAGAFMGWLAATGDASPEGLRRAAVYGTLVASFNCEAFSTERLQTLTREDVDARREVFAQMLRF